MSVFCYIFYEQVIVLLSGMEFLEAVPYHSGHILMIVAWVFVLYFTALLCNYVLMAAKKERALLMVNALVVIVNIIGNAWAIPQYSILGAAIVSVVSQVIFCIAAMYAAKKYVHINVPYAHWCMISAGILIIALITIYIPHTYVAMIVYVVSCIVLGWKMNQKFLRTIADIHF